MKGAKKVMHTLQTTLTIHLNFQKGNQNMQNSPYCVSHAVALVTQ
jgi:hypothetical protein